jgi:hypothetical protein
MAMRAWPTHENHGEPGFVTCRRSIIEGVLDELDQAEKERDEARADSNAALDDVAKAEARVAELDRALAKAHEHLRDVARAGDTLSPQEFINHAVAGGALDFVNGTEFPTYAGQMHPHRSIVELTARIAALTHGIHGLATMVEKHAGEPYQSARLHHLEAVAMVSSEATRLVADALGPAPREPKPEALR